MKYDCIAKLSHWGIALFVSVQLLSEEFMKRPKLIDGVPRVRSDGQVLFFDIHEWVGLVVLLVIVLRFIFIINRNEWDKLFPWFTTKGLNGLMAELKEIPGWLMGKLRDAGEEDYLAKTVHGLGLLLVLAMAILGTILFFGMNPDGTMGSFVHLCKETHELLGEVLWIYFYGHVFMALYHQLLGHRVFQRIFSFKA